jgi:CheY-like chemotaxis protein
LETGVFYWQLLVPDSWRKGAAMKLKILVFDHEQSLRQLLKTFLLQLGHEVEVYSDPAVCPLYRDLLNDTCSCPRETPCADVVFAGIDTHGVNAVEFLRVQRNRGCKMLDANKAVMSNYLTSALDQAIATFGCHHIGKPFRLTDIRKWLQECTERLAETKKSTS